MNSSVPKNDLEARMRSSASLRPLTAEEDDHLKEIIRGAREDVAPTVKKLRESEAVSNDLLRMRLELRALYAGR